MQALSLLADVGYLVEAARKVTAAQFGVGVAWYFASYQPLHKLPRGHFKAENGGVQAVGEGSGVGEGANLVP